MLRNALAAAPLSEGENNSEMCALFTLIDALFQISSTQAIDEVEPLVEQLPAKTENWSLHTKLHRLRCSARLHEVGNPCTMLSPCIPPSR